MSAVAICLSVAAAGLLCAAPAAENNYQAAKSHARALLAEHQYHEALRAARELNRRMPDDLDIYGLMVDADMALGDLKDAEKQAQWMLDLGARQPNIGGLVHAAHLRMLLNDPEGALQFVGDALARTLPTEADRRATLLGFGAWLELLQGRRDESLSTAASALRLSDRNACALAVAARAHSDEQKRPTPQECPCDLSF